MEVEKITTWLPITQEALADMLCPYCMFAPGDPAPLTPTETETGYRRYTCRNGHEGRFSVGWRAEKERVEAEAKREAEMAACPYTACECGHHESDY